MKQKVLILGALPEILEGPWVDLTEGKEWEVRPREDYLGCVEVEVVSPDAPARFKVNGEPVRINGTRARGHLLDGVSDLGVKSITVQLVQVA